MGTVIGQVPIDTVARGHVDDLKPWIADQEIYLTVSKPKAPSRVLQFAYFIPRPWA